MIFYRDFSDNFISGTIPSEFGDLTFLNNMFDYFFLLFFFSFFFFNFFLKQIIQLLFIFKNRDLSRNYLIGEISYQLAYVGVNNEGVSNLYFFISFSFSFSSSSFSFSFSISFSFSLFFFSFFFSFSFINYSFFL